MRLYELLFITHPDSDDEKVQSVITRYKEVIEAGKGILKSAEKWGKRRFAYEIDDQKEGLYILADFQSGTDVPKEIDRLMKIDQDIVRHVIVRKDEKAQVAKPRKRPLAREQDEPRGPRGEDRAQATPQNVEPQEETQSQEQSE